MEFSSCLNGGTYLDVTKVMAYFSMVGDHFPLDEITKELAIEPTETYVKGDIIESVGDFTRADSPKMRRIETDWTLSTGYQNSLDINGQLKPILKALKDKQKELIRLKEKYGLTYIFSVVITIENNQTPAMHLEKDIIDFASAIGAEIGFDLYV